jgi:hypothetical protein
VDLSRRNCPDRSIRAGVIAGYLIEAMGRVAGLLSQSNRHRLAPAHPARRPRRSGCSTRCRW